MQYAKTIAAAAFFCLAFVRLASAAPPENADPSLAPWFKSLTSNDGMSCCGAADCRHNQVIVQDGSYWVIYLGKALQVPSSVVSKRTDNPTGDYVSCVQDQRWLNGEQIGPLVLCFFLAPRT